jgi:hypothetical protein
MKKFTTISVAIVLTLAGCTASSVFASTKSQDTKLKAPLTVVELSPGKKSQTDFTYITSSNKEVRNYLRMSDLLKYVKTRVNKTPYVFSGSSTRGWDCSGLVRWLYSRFGLDIPHSADKQGHIGTRVSDPMPGDVVVFAYQGSTNFYHSAIYIGNGKIVHANQARKTTVIEPLSSYKNSQIRFVRVLDQVEWSY